MSRLIALRRGDRGSAVVDFVVVMPLLLVLVLAVVQIGLAGYVRSTLASAAAEGARVAAVSGGDPQLAVRRTRSSLASTVAADTIASVTAHRSVTSGTATVQVDVVARLPLVGLLGPAVMRISGHALVEP